MGKLLKFVIVLLIADSTSVVNFGVFATSTVAKSFEKAGLKPDVVPTAPNDLAEVEYPNGVVVQLGNELTPAQVTVEPQVFWEADQDSFYTLAMVDPDVPSRKLPTLGEFRHWLVGNIKGCNVSSGVTLSPYIGSTPPPGTGLHRYTFLVYEQPGKIKFDEPLLSTVNPTGFSIAKFAEKYEFGDPIAGNFFVSQSSVNPPLV